MYYLYSSTTFTYSNIVYYALRKPDDSIGYGNYTRTNVTSDKFLPLATGNLDTAENIGKVIDCADNYSLWFGFPIDTTLEQAQAIGDIKVFYPLATPTFTPFEDQTSFYNFEVYDEITYISIAGCHEELEPVINIKFPINEDGALVTANWRDINLNKIEMSNNFNELENVVIEIQSTREPSYQKTGNHWLLEY